MKLIINGDDFGHTRGINFGIIEAFRRGILRSTTVMTNRPAFSNAMELARENPGLGVGVHLVITSGKPLGEGYKTIIRPDGCFYRPGEFEKRVNGFDRREIEAEFILQIEAVKNQGTAPSHLDSHHHAHMNPAVLPAALKLAERYGLPVRIFNRNLIPKEYKHIKTTSAFVASFYDNDATKENLINILEQYRDAEVLEIMTHPGYADRELIEASAYNRPRERELSILTHPDIIKYIVANGIELINYNYL